jgi:hypothetical protein
MPSPIIKMTFFARSFFRSGPASRRDSIIVSAVKHQFLSSCAVHLSKKRLVPFHLDLIAKKVREGFVTFELCNTYANPPSPIGFVSVNPSSF